MMIGMFRVLFVFIVSLNLLAPTFVHANDSEVQEREEETVRERLREEREEALEKRQEELEKIRERREEAVETRERKQDEFQLKLQTIKDERKQKIVENLAERIVSMNNRWADHWGNVLGRLSDILIKISLRTDTLATSGKEVGGVQIAITKAQEAISVAQKAVSDQAVMSYDIEISTEDTLGEVVSGSLGDFHDDLKETQELVKAARDAVKEALDSLRDVEVANEK